MSRPLLVTGAAGFVGGEVVRQAAAAGAEVVGTVHTRPAEVPAEVRPVDLRDAAAVQALVEAVRPAAIVHPAYVQNDWAATAVAPGHLAAAARSVGAEFVQVSSDAVFAGGPQPVDEDEPPRPVAPYGAAKASAETVVRALHPGAAVVRISLQVGGAGSATERLVREVAHGERDAVFFTDDMRCAGHVEDTAAALLELVGRPGVHHLAGADAVTRLELAQLLCAHRGWPTERLRAGTRAEAGVGGPGEVRLDGRRTQANLRTQMRGAREFLSPDA